MNMIEVDPMLYITCRLCLDEIGQYQIVPKVQMQIKYCFDIDVEPFDGFPQLLCKKCENVLSQYAGIKQMYQEKQSSLKTKIIAKDKASVYTQQQQDTVSSTQQVDSDSNFQSSNKMVLNNSTSSIERSSSKSDYKKVSTDNIPRKYRNPSCKLSYLRSFVCRFCSKSLKDKRSIIKHLKHCYLIKKYSGIVKNCIVVMNKIGSRPNLISTKENVVCNKDKIINCKNKNYNVVYTLKSEKTETSDSSDDDFNVIKKKPKRRRLLSKSSIETLVIDKNNTPKNSVHTDNEKKEQVEKYNTNKDSTDRGDIDFVNIDDSDSASTTSTLKTSFNKTDIVEKSQDFSVTNDKTITNIITMCYNKYLKKNEVHIKKSKSTENDKDSFLQRKILSMGGKVIHNMGLNSIGLIRYMEHKDLDVDWIPKHLTNVFVKITLRENKNDSYKTSFKSLKDVDNSYEHKDFIDIFEKTSRQGNNPAKNITRTSNKETYISEIESQNDVNDEILTGLNNSQSARPTLLSNNDKIMPDNCVPIKPSKEQERKVQNPVLFVRTNSESKILNANPVANPKQLPKKFCPTELYTLLTNSNAPLSSCIEMPTPNESANNNCKNQLSMPIITSTVSLAGCSNNQVKLNETSAKNDNQEVDKALSPILPRIKVKPVSELMPEKNFNQQRNPIGTLNAWSHNACQNNLLQNGGNIVFMTNSSSNYTNIAPVSSNVMNSQFNRNQYPNINVPSISNIESVNTNISCSQPSQSLINTSRVAQKPNSCQYVTMHTVELPNKKTNSPFRYFQELLQMHNMVLLNTTEVERIAMICLIKFKLMFQQESIAPVTLCLSLFCNQSMFCVGVKDTELKHIDIAELSANWQWEILKEFKGHVVSKLYENARKISPDIYSKTNKFVNLLNSITFSKI